jgi:hypothetical protein
MGYTLIISYVRRLAPLFLFETSRDAVTPKAHAVTDIHAGELTYWIGPQSGKEIGLDYDGDGKVSEVNVLTSGFLPNLPFITTLFMSIMLSLFKCRLGGKVVVSIRKLKS